jgi:hypothetical protein
MNAYRNGNGILKDESSTVIYNPANPYLVSPYEPLQSTQQTNTLRVVYTDVITSFTPNTEIQVGAPVTIENVTVNGSSVGSAGQISNGATSVRADLAAIRYTIIGDEQVKFIPGNAQFASALTSYNVTIGGKWNIYNTVATTQKGLAGYVPLAVNDTQYSMPIFADASFSIVPTPTSETVTGTTAINTNTDISYLSGSTNTLPIGTVAGQKKLLINLNTNVQTFSPLGPAPGALTATDVNAIAVTSPTTVYIGGQSLDVSGLVTNSIVRWNPQTQTYSSAGTDLPVTICNSITSVSPTNIFAGLDNPYGNTGGGIYNSNGTSWTLVGNGISSPSTVASFVYATYYDDVSNNLYVGGDFERVNGTVTSARSLAVYNTVTGTWSTALGDIGGFTTPRIVRAILKVGSVVFVGGDFTSIGGTTLGSIGRWDGLSWQQLGTSGLIGADTNTCLAMATGGTYLYVGGIFDSADGIPNTANFARYDISENEWSSITNITPVNGPCRAITVTATDVYIGGSFTLVNSVLNTARIARYDIALETWNALGTGIADANNCTALATDAFLNLYIGGDYTGISGNNIDRIAYYSTSNQTVVSAVVGALRRNGATYTTMTFKRQYATILLCYNGINAWVIVQTNPFVLFT